MPKRTFKKRPKGFYGTQRQFITTEEPSSHTPGDGEASTGVQASTSVERPAPLETASGKKLAISPGAGTTRAFPRDLESLTDEEESYEYVGKLKGYRLVKIENLASSVSEIGVCSKCSTPLTLKEDLSIRRGLIAKLLVTCSNSECEQ